MDRNSGVPAYRETVPVALRKESVDRNVDAQNLSICVIESLSARRAWIEMWVLRKVPILGIKSLSARRAWIEISIIPLVMLIGCESLSARRAWIEIQAFSVSTL